MAAIFQLSSHSRPPGSGTATAIAGGVIAGQDLGHAVAFAALALAVWWGLRAVMRNGWQAIPAAWLVSAAYGALDEWHQSFVPRRWASFADWGCDAIGAAAACAVIAVAYLVARWQSSLRRLSATNGR